MGSGDFGSDGSVYWNVKYSDVATDPTNEDGHDDTKKHPDRPGNDPRPPIGDGKAGAGLLRVTIRCKNAAEAAKLLSDAAARTERHASSSESDPARRSSVTAAQPDRFSFPRFFA